jgi:hypothetical protein
MIFLPQIPASWNEMQTFRFATSPPCSLFQELSFCGLWGKWASDSSLPGARLRSYRPDRRRKEPSFVKRCSRFWKSPVRDKRMMLLRMTNAGCTGILTIIDEGRRSWGSVSSNPSNDFIGQDCVFGLLRSPGICFHRNTLEKRTIQFGLPCSHNSAKCHLKSGFASPENTAQGRERHIAMLLCHLRKLKTHGSSDGPAALFP